MSIDERTNSAQHDELSDDALESVAGGVGGVAGLSGLTGLGGNDVALGAIGGAPLELQQPLTESPIARLTTLD